MQKLKVRGFTLIELMIVVAVIGILAAVAVPSYRSYMLKSNRTAAKAQMLDLANRQQQYLLANRAYATKAQLTGTGYVLPSEVSKYYGWDVTTASTPPAYTVTFTATGSQLPDGDLTINSEGVKQPTDKW